VGSTSPRTHSCRVGGRLPQSGTHPFDLNGQPDLSSRHSRLAQDDVEPSFTELPAATTRFLKVCAGGSSLARTSSRLPDSRRAATVVINSTLCQD
jgi:hypothetical protein